eukprot:COSAG04_NODE_170_length_21634_cov_12.250337_8_plen_153_part_00
MTPAGFQDVVVPHGAISAEHHQFIVQAPAEGGGKAALKFRVSSGEDLGEWVRAVNDAAAAGTAGREEQARAVKKPSGSGRSRRGPSRASHSHSHSHSHSRGSERSHSRGGSERGRTSSSRSKSHRRTRSGTSSRAAAGSPPEGHPPTTTRFR